MTKTFKDLCTSVKKPLLKVIIQGIWLEVGSVSQDSANLRQLRAAPADFSPREKPVG